MGIKDIIKELAMRERKLNAHSIKYLILEVSACCDRIIN